MARPIRVRPAPEQRRDFARWATGQSPRIRTVSSSVFAVPPELFVLAPEEYLLGALVDGHRYVSPLEAEDQEQAGVEGTPVLPEQEAALGDVLPDLPETAYGPDAVALDLPEPRLLDCGLCFEEDGEEVHPHPECAAAASSPPAPADFAPLDDAPTDEEQAGTQHLCADCGNPYATARGLATHRRAKHPEE